MNIIIEGPDGSGKSTLVKYLSHALKLPMYLPGGSPDIGFIERLCEQQSSMTHIIYDRVTCISDAVYRKDSSILESHRVLMSKNSVLILCTGEGRHESEDWESDEYCKFLEENKTMLTNKYMRLYDEWVGKKFKYNFKDRCSTCDYLK